MIKLWNRGRPAATSDRSSEVVKPSSSLFEGIAERDVVSLYNVAKVRQLSAGAKLYRHNDLAESVYVVLKGMIRTEPSDSSSAMEPQFYAEGGWIVGADFNRQSHRLNSALAVGAASVLVIKKSSMQAMDESLRQYVNAKIQTATLQALTLSSQQRDHLATEIEQLKQELVRVRSRGKSEFVKSEVIQGVINKIPRLPVSSVDLVNKLLYQEVKTLEMVELVRNDPALTTLLLKTINSSFYNFRQNIADVNHAVGLLGFDSVYQIIMAESFRQSLPETPVFQQIYQHSLQISHIAFAVSQASQVGRPAELATLGLVHETGSVVLELLKKQNPKLAGLIELIDSPDVAAELLGSWNLPQRICSTIRYQQHPEYTEPTAIPADILNNTAIIYIAHLCYELLHKRPQQQLPLLFLNDYLELLGWQQQSLAQLLNSQVIPALKKRIEVLPKELVELLPG